MFGVNATVVPLLDNSTFSVKTPFINVTPSIFRNFSLVVNIILTQFVCVFGLIGNSIGLVVLWRDPNKQRLTIYTYLFALMSIDTVFLCIGICYSINDTIEYFDWYLGNTIKRHIWFVKGYSLTLHKHLLAVLLIIMSLERLLSLLYPFDIKRFFLSKYPRVVIILTSVLSALYLIPMYVGFRLVSFKDENNKTVYANVVDPGYYKVFITYTYVETLILHYFAPFTVLLLNILLTVFYTRFLKERRSKMKVDPSSTSQNKITVLVFCVATLYVILSLPNLFLQTLLFIDEDYSFYGPYKLVFFLFMDLGDFLVRFNAATDCVMYILVVSRYRHLCKTMLCKFFFRHKEEPSSEMGVLGSSSKSHST